MTEPTPLEVHRAALVIDGHCDSLFVPFGQRRDITTRADFGDVDVPRLLEGGVTGQFMALLVNDERGGAARALEGIDLLYNAIERSRSLTLATRAEHLREAKAAGCVAAILHVEGSDALEGRLSSLRLLHRLGVRSLGLTHNARNRAGDGIDEAATGGGLSSFGKAVLAELDRLGMLVDISHLSPAGVQDVFAQHRLPVIASHSNAFAVHPHPRNLSDQELEQLAATGGVACVTFVADFLNDGVPTLDHVLDHIDHMVRVVGPEHVGIGSDFDGFQGVYPTGLEDITCYPALTAGLLARGHSPAAVRSIMGGNLLRVIEHACS